MKIKRFFCNMLSENCYVLERGGKFVVVDPGFCGETELEGLYALLGDSAPEAVLLTHAHFDHTLGVKPLQQKYPGLPVYMAPEDVVLLEEDARYACGLGIKDFDFSFDWTPVRDGDELRFDGGFAFRAVATPGHTPGGLCWYCPEEGVVFTGDTLFADTIGRTDLAFGDYDSEIRSIMEKLMLLPGSTDVLPGHGRATTIERERMSNPFLEPFNEPEEEFDEDLPGISLHGYMSGPGAD